MSNADTTSKIFGFVYSSGKITLWRGFVVNGALASFGNTLLGRSQGGTTVDFTLPVFEKLSASSARVVQSASEVFN